MQKSRGRFKIAFKKKKKKLSDLKTEIEMFGNLSIIQKSIVDKF